MKSKIIFVLLFAVTLPTHAVQKCTDSEGQITYADFCPVSVPSKVENLYIPDTYDPEAARITQENYRGMEESTRQSEYDRAQRNAKTRGENTLPDTPSSTASNVGGSGSSRPSRALRSGSSFDEQFSAALKRKLDLQKSKAKLIDAGGNPSYGSDDSGRAVEVINSDGSVSHGWSDSAGNVEVINSDGSVSHGRSDSAGNVEVINSDGSVSHGQ